MQTFAKLLALTTVLSIGAASSLRAEPGPDKEPAAATPSAQAKVEFDKTTLDLGQVIKGEKAKFTFDFKNGGSSDLEIKQAKPSCGCTIASFTRVVKPGEKGQVVATIDTQRFKGPITKTVTVTCNDPATPTINLQMKATVKPILDVQPSEHVYFRVFRGDDVPTKRVLTITSDENEPFKITGVESSNPAVTTKLVDLKKQGANDEASGNAYQLEVDVAKDAPIGPLNGTITVNTTHPKVKSLTLNVNGQVLGEVIVTPQKVFLGQLTKATAPSVKRTVRIERRTGNGFKIEKVESTNAGIQAEIAPVEEGKVYTLTISVGPDLPAGNINANVVVKTNDKEQSSIEIPVIGTVRG